MVSYQSLILTCHYDYGPPSKEAKKLGNPTAEDSFSQSLYSPSKSLFTLQSPQVVIFLARVFVISERVGGLGVYSFLLEEEPNSFILNNILVMYLYFMLLSYSFPCLFYILYFSTLGFY